MKLKLCTALLAAATLFAPLSVVAEKAQNPAEAKRAAVATYGKLPLSFEPTAESSRFVAHSGGYTVAVGPNESSVVVAAHGAGKSQTLHFAFENANPAAPLEAVEVQPGVTNYYLGQDRSKWRLGVKNYAKLRAQGVYPGVDVIYYGDHRQLEFDFVVAPKADPRAIGLTFSGMEKLYKDASGDLVAEVGGQPVRFAKPYAYQKIAGASKPVEADYELAATGDVHLRVGNYDKSSELIIDPVVSYVTYLGGSLADAGNAIAMDSTGVYVTGETSSTDFPDTSSPSGESNSSSAFITKYSLDGTKYLYTTILGGSTADTSLSLFAQGNGIAVDPNHQVYVAGTTSVEDMPETSACSSAPTRCYQGGDSDAFIVILNADGTLQNITYLGGGKADQASAIAIDRAVPPNVIVVGQTQSKDFPGYSAFEAPIEKNVAFVTKLDNNLDIASQKLSSSSAGYIAPELSVFAPAPPPGPTYTGANNCTSSASGPCFFFSEFIGGQIMTIAPAATAKWTEFTQFPAGVIVYDNESAPHSQLSLNAGCSGPYVPPPATATNIPLPAWNSTLWGLTYDVDTANDPACGPQITWEDLGAVGVPVFHNSAAYGVAVDSSPGDVYVVGGTDSDLTPFTEYTGSGAWIFKVSGVDGSDTYSTVLETNSSNKSNPTVDAASAVAVDSHNRAYVTGTVTGTLFTSPNAYQPTMNGVTNAFLSRMTLSGGNIDIATYLGGSGSDTGSSVAVDASGNAYVTGSTASTNFPTVDPIVNPSTNKLLNTLSGTMDAFVAKFSAETGAATFSTYLGGSDTTQGNAIAVDPILGDMYLAGNTTSTNLGLLNPSGYTAPQPLYGGNGDAFVAKVAVSGAGIAGLATISLPSSLPFGSQPVGQSTSLPVTLTNSSSSAVLTISQILSSGSSDFTVDHSACPTSLTAGESCTINVTFLPTSATSESANFSVSGNATNSPQTVTLTGTGTAAQGTISLPASLVFGNVSVSTPSTKSATFSNTTSLAITNLVYALSGTNSGNFSIGSGTTCGATLAANATCQISVTFTPSAAATETATLTVTGSATNSPQSVTLTGTGTTAATGSALFTVTPASPGVSITQGGTAVYSLSVAPSSGFNGSITFTCSGPVGSSCSASPNPWTMNGTALPTVTVSVNTNGGNGTTATARFGSRSIFLALLPFSMMGILLINRKRGCWLALLLVVLCLLLGLVGCGTGTGSSTSGALAPGNYQVIVTAASGTTTQNIQLNLVVNKQ